MRKCRILAALLLAGALLLNSLFCLAEALERGSRGEAVRELQQALNDAGYDVGTPDGDFGRNTEKALKAWQKDHGLPETGTLDEETRAALYGADETGNASEEQPAFDAAVHGYRYFLGNCSWKEANDRAIAMGGRLVNIDSTAEYDELKSELLELGQADAAFWIGARRDYLASGSSEYFYWVDEYGQIAPEPIAQETLLDGYIPWAVGEPSFTDEEGAHRSYVRMRYEPAEARWVWENTTGEADAGRTMGYIVEFEDVPTRAHIQRGAPEPEPLTASAEPAYEPARSGDAYAILDAKLGRGTIFLKTRAEEWCGLLYTVLDHRDRQILQGTAWARKDAEGSWAAYPLTEAQREEIREQAAGGQGFRFTAQLWSVDWERNVLTKAVTGVYTSPVYQPEDLQPAKRREEKGGDLLYRVTPVLASAPAARDEARGVQILSAADGTVLRETFAGAAVYLEPGDYIARLADGSAAGAAFSVADDPVLVEIPDWETRDLEGQLKDAENGEPIPGATVYLEARGGAYETSTDEDGGFRFAGLPPVEAGLWAYGAGVAMELEPRRVHAGQAAGRVIVETPRGRKVTFFGYLHDGGAAWTEAYEAFMNAGPYDEQRWFMGHGWYLEVEQDIANTNGEGALYDYGTNAVAEKKTFLAEDSRADMEERIAFDMLGDTSELIVATGWAVPDRMRQNNPQMDEWFEGWSDWLIDWGDADTALERPIDAYYHKLLDSIEKGEDPLKHSVIRAIVLRRWREGGMWDWQAESAMESLRSAQNPWRDTYLLSLFNYELNINGTEGPYYSPSDNTLYMPLITRSDVDYFNNTFFHESGHAVKNSMPSHHLEDLAQREPVSALEERIDAIDEFYRDGLQGSLQRDLETLIRREILAVAPGTASEDDIQAVIDAFINADEAETTGWILKREKETAHASVRDDPKRSSLYEQVRDRLEERIYKIPFSNASMVSDVIGGFTNNKLAGYPPVGHNSVNADGVPYWYDTSGTAKKTQMEEAWAEYYSAQVRRDAYNMEQNRAYFPGANTMMDRISSVVYEAYLDLAKQTYAE